MAYSSFAVEFLKWAPKDLAHAEAILKEHPKVIHSRSGLGETLLHFLAVENCPEAVRLLIRCGADVNTRNQSGSTPLHEAALLGYREVVQLLVENEADVDIKNKLGETPLNCAVRSSTPSREVVQLLIQADADINADAGFGETPLAVAIRSRKNDIAKLLKDAGARDPESIEPA